MATRNNIGKTLYISAAHPATNDTTGFQALTWTQVESPLTLFQLGSSNAMIDVEHLVAGFTEAVKGQATGNESTATFAIDDSTLGTGQSALKTAANSAGGVLSVKIGTGTGTGGALQTGDDVQYAYGIVHSYLENEITSGTTEGFSVSFRQNDYTVTGTEPV